MSVIVLRALPDVKDGLKQFNEEFYIQCMRRIRPTGPFRKCSKVVGDVMGNYHPHGNKPIYGTLVRLGQHFSTRYPLIEPQETLVLLMIHQQLCVIQSQECLHYHLNT